jgi:hypothetical protein
MDLGAYIDNNINNNNNSSSNTTTVRIRLKAPLAKCTRLAGREQQWGSFSEFL